MMFPKSAFVVALFAASAKLVAATPPACLLAAVNTQPDPTDFGSICHTNAGKMRSQINSLCGTSTQVAMGAFSATCKANGYNIAQVESSKPSKTTESSKSHKTEEHTGQKATKKAESHATKAAKPQKPTEAAPYPTGASSAAPAPSATGSVYPTSSPLPTYQPDNAGGKVDAESFAAIALAAAGLVIFL